MLVADNIDAVDFAGLKSALHSRYQSSTDSSAAMIRMDRNTEVTAIIFLNSSNQRSDNFVFFFSNDNEIGIPRKLSGKRLHGILETLFGQGGLQQLGYLTNIA
ncbi:hypothetical protein D3C71_1924290 [compost metagenome]